MTKNRSGKGVDDSLLESASGGAGATGGHVTITGNPKVSFNVTSGNQTIKENGQTISSSNGSSIDIP